MHEVITEFPKGVVIGSLRIARGNRVVDVTRLRYGSRTRFVERATVQGPDGPQQTAYRKSDDFPSEKIANRFIADWLTGITENRKYQVVHKDPGFDTGNSEAQNG